MQIGNAYISAIYLFHIVAAINHIVLYHHMLCIAQQNRRPAVRVKYVVAYQDVPI
jgi:hypothetical protein